MQASHSTYKIKVQDLKFGMYVSQLDRPWLETPYSIQGILIADMEDILELEQHCKYVYVDIARCESHIVRKYHLGKFNHVLSNETSETSLNALNNTTIPETTKKTREIRQTPRAVVEKTPFHGSQIYDDISTVEEELPVATQVQQIAHDAIKEITIDFERNQYLEVSGAQNTVYALRDSIVRNPDAMLLLVQLKSSGEALYDDAVKHSILLMAFGRHLGLPRNELSLLGLGGMLMDIGKLRLREKIAGNQNTPDTAGMNLSKEHVLLGEQMIKQSSNIPASVYEIVAQHHEREDGRGYPRGLSANQLNTYARMAAIVDNYLELLKSQANIPSNSASQVFNQLKALARYGLNATLVEQFTHCLGFFPVGSLVELNTGEVAVILSHSRSKRSLPAVMVILDANKQPYKMPETRDLRLMKPGPDGIPYTIERDLPSGAYGIDATSHYL
ncbi:HD-GYP domain, c-di-GMP phosphodiesterase class II (or its inactivated variant) [Nitrosomonas sp. Nm51]|uniref:HD-GYP domain-containing protein n=1 Tax=Nitrosomonas sp. Nm51 TaxID=133720 RepID=UPI0008D3A856|nr:HD-GYP domain-containing protein [Nitrosomonas sp. Nm51]SER06985.1 HD-GYP domain, c-di-GMP phosphodiesterase class II (or its inactivated variant) [Nitrosomonas sp. Nm51]